MFKTITRCLSCKPTDEQDLVCPYQMRTCCYIFLILFWQRISKQFGKQVWVVERENKAKQQPQADETRYFARFIDSEGNKIGLHSPN